MGRFVPSLLDRRCQGSTKYILSSNKGEIHPYAWDHRRGEPHLLEGDVEGPEDARDAAHACGQVIHLALGDAPGAGRAEAGHAQPREGRQEAPAPAEGLEVHLVRRHGQQLVTLHQLVVHAHQHLRRNRHHPAMPNVKDSGHA